MAEVSAGDVEKAIQVLEELAEKTSDAINHVTALIQKVKDEQIRTTKGVSFLEMKYQLLLSYLIDLTMVMNTKVRGNSIQDHPSIERLVEIRTVLEKIKPIDQKLKYQIDKLVKTATTGSLAENDPLRFKPNPDGLVSKLEEKEGSSEEEEEEADDDTPRVYRPPRVAPAYYEGDVTRAERQMKAKERMEKKIRSSRLMKDLQAELYEGPEEIRDDANLHRAKFNKLEEEKTRYEEEHFLRMVGTKKEKSMARRLRTVNQMRDITDFGGLGALTGEADLGDDFLPKKKSGPGGKKRKGKLGKKGSSKKKKRF